MNTLSHRPPLAAFRVDTAKSFTPQQRKLSSYYPHRRVLVEDMPLASDAQLTTPLGGIGTGGITWDRAGRFSRWTLSTGDVAYFCEPACGFAARWQSANQPAEALALQPAPTRDDVQLNAWQFRPAEDDKPTCDAVSMLYPSTWRDVTLPKHAPLALSCQSFSPVISGDLNSSSLPVALFQWTLTNTSDSPLSASIMLHWANLNHWFKASTGEMTPGRPTRQNQGKYNAQIASDDLHGVIMDARRAMDHPAVGNGQWGIAMLPTDGVRTSVCEAANGLAENAELWQSFVQSGHVPNQPAWLADGGFRTEETGLPMAALCAEVALAAGESRTLTFGLCWDLPTIEFGYGRQWQRAYTQQWGSAGRSAEAMLRYALQQVGNWQQAIHHWHQSEMTKYGDQPSEAGYLLNELYLLCDGATVYTAATADSPAQFALLECTDYPYYNTLDLWVYAQQAILSHWPELAGLVLDNYQCFIALGDATQRKAIYSDERFALMLPGRLPHDIGAPEEDPFYQANAYALKDSNQWKDLGCHYVLSVYATGQSLGLAWRQSHYATVQLALQELSMFDHDADGLIENAGTTDQTFDNIPMQGASAYCAGLWLAALSAGIEMAEQAGDIAQAQQWAGWLAAGKAAYVDKLWTGAYFKLDESGPFSEALFLEQLFGPFLARRYGLADIVPPEHARQALQTLYAQNFSTSGLGIGPKLMDQISRDGLETMEAHGDTSVQVTEVIIGIACSFIAQCRCWGLQDQADSVQKSLYGELYEARGLHFRTPAAIEVSRQVYRAPMNLRPLAIWLQAERAG